MSLQYGLYAAFLPLVGYAGCPASHMSRHLAVGPVALVSFLLKSGLTPLTCWTNTTTTTITTSATHCNNYNSNNYKMTMISIRKTTHQTKYNQLAIQCSLLLGISYLILGWCRLGCVTVFLSHDQENRRPTTTPCAVPVVASRGSIVYHECGSSAEHRMGAVATFLDR